MRRLLSIFIITCSLTAGWFWMAFQQSIHRSYISEEMGTVIVKIDKGQHFKQIVTTLDNQGVVDGRWFSWLVRSEGVANKIQAGEYSFSAGLTPVQILSYLLKGKVNQYSFTLIEGQTFREVLSALHKNKAIKVSLPKHATIQTYLELLNIPEKHLEGLLLADTYFFVKGSTDAELIMRAYRSMQAYINTAWSTRDKKEVLPSIYSALILASIVEKETAAIEERATIAGLFLARLSKGMRLQTDPTVIYGMGDRYKGDIRYKDLREDTPYNTYTRYGLPPTPIAMPGKGALNAVLHPNKTSFLYFVSKGDGTHVFSKNLRQHNQAVNKYQR